MDFIKIRERISTIFAKYKYVCAVLLAGIAMMVIPTNRKDDSDGIGKMQEQIVEEFTIQGQLEDILCQIEGAGRVSVMLSIAQGERMIYQTDNTHSKSEDSTDTRTQTIVVSDGQRNENGLVQQKFPPIYQGAIILAQGANLPSVKLAIVEAVCDITGLGSDKISVLKMK